MCIRDSINGGHAEARRNWPRDRPMPARMLNGAHPFADGELHHHAADQLGARITHAGEMWNYAAGYPHPFPHFPGHGLSTIPCKSALWLDHRGQRIGPQPLVTGFDTHWLCQQVAAQEQPWTCLLYTSRCVEETGQSAWSSSPVREVPCACSRRATVRSDTPR